MVIVTHIGIGLAVTMAQWSASEIRSPQMVTLNLLEGRPVIPRANTSKQSTREDLGEMNTVGQDSNISNNTQSESVLSDASMQKSFRNRNLLINTRPPYPLVSRRMREQGAVHLKLCINQNGFVDNIELLKSSGHALLDKSALSTVQAWRFSALNVTHPSIECYRLPIHFALEG